LEETRTGFTLNTPLVAAVAANLLWGMTFLASKSTLAAWGPFTAGALRFLLATAFLSLGAWIFGQSISLPKSKKEWIGLFWISLTSFGLLYPLQLTGLQTISSSLSAALMLTCPLFVVMFGAIFLKEPIGTTKIVAILFGITGGVMLVSTGHGVSGVLDQWSSPGSVFTLMASISLAASVILTRRLSSQISTTNLTFWSMVMGSAMLSVSAVAFERNREFISDDMNAWVALLFLALVCSAICFFMWNFAIHKASPKQIASTMHLKTPMAVILGIVLLEEKLSTGIWIGASLVMFGVFLSQLSVFKKGATVK
jgi:drug/metabolite transporter (DMT)-like permease